MNNILEHLAFVNLNHWEIVIILAIVLIIFGPKSLPALGRSLGKGLREFKSASSKFTDALDDAADEDERKKESESKSQKQIEQQGSSMPQHDLEVKDSVSASSEQRGPIIENK